MSCQDILFAISKLSRRIAEINVELYSAGDKKSAIDHLNTMRRPLLNDDPVEFVGWVQNLLGRFPDQMAELIDMLFTELDVEDWAGLEAILQKAD